MFITSRKGLTTLFLVSISIAILTLLVLSFFGYGVIQSNMYSSSVLECRQLFRGIQTSPSEVNLNFMQAVASACSAKHVTVNSERQISEASNLILDCWRKTGEGRNFFGTGVHDSVCLYCGRIKTTRRVDNFGELLANDLAQERFQTLFREDIDSINLNVFMEELFPVEEGLEEGTDIAVIYYIRTNDLEKRSFGEWSTDFVGTRIRDRIDSRFAAPVETLITRRTTSAGIYLTPILEYQQVSSLEIFENCNFIFPNTVH